VMIQRKSEDELRRTIEEFYLRRQLVDVIFEAGEIPSQSVVRTIGIGFLDIVDYAYLSRFLSPAENQVLLNGLYTAFHSVLRRHGGYLNKIEGDSIMFHYGGPVDPRTRDLPDELSAPDVARRLFRSCVEMQEVCIQFNRADDRFLENQATPQDQEMLDRGFAVMDAIRNQSDIAQSLNAFFQVQIRIGAHIGQVTVGNLGPAGARQWDIVGEPVIKARRMEQTAPAGGLRVTQELYNQLESAGVVEEYHTEFRRKAAERNGLYSSIGKAELFVPRTVRIQAKSDITFDTYKVQVHPDHPEALASQVSLLCERGEEGIARALDMISYHRGDIFIIRAIEQRLAEMGITVRTAPMIRAMFPRVYRRLVHRRLSSDEVDRRIDRRFSLQDVFERLGACQDALNHDEEARGLRPSPFTTYRQYLAERSAAIDKQYRKRKERIEREAYFHDLVLPTVFESLRADMLEHYYATRELEAVETA